VSKTKVRTVVIGVGAMGRNHLKHLAAAPEAKIVGVSDVSEKLARKIAREYNVPWSTNVAEIIEKTKPIAATIASPHPTHLEIALECFRHKLHVFTDKPMTSLVSEADRMIAAARKARRILAVMFQFRCEIAVRRAKELVASGKIGEIGRVSLFCSSYRTQAYFRASPWRGTWNGEGGGVLTNQAPHMLDAMIHLTMMPSAVTGRCTTVNHNIETEDRADALLDYANGAVGHVFATTAEAPSFCRLEISGDRGRIEIEDFKSLRIGRLSTSCQRFTRSSRDEWGQPPVKWQEIDLTPRRGEMVHHGANIRDFVQAVQKGRKPMVTGESGRQSLELANAIVLSAFQGKTIKMPVKRRQYDRLLDYLCRRGTGRAVQDSIRTWRSASRRPHSSLLIDK
jgi:predicted dehydrogenase